MKLDLELLAARGANLCGEDKLEIRACASCDRHYLYNGMLKDLYYDPFNLAKHYFVVKGMDLPPCAGCGELHWKLTEPVPEAEAIVGAWGWLINPDV